MTRRAALIGIDWGTTSFRAYRIDAGGGVIETREAPAGILAVRDGDFEGVLTREIGAWLAAEPDLPVIASGMITSRQGWLEVPYCACPAGSAQIAAALHAPSRRGRALHFVPGLSLIGERRRAGRDPRRGDADRRRGRRAARPPPARAARHAQQMGARRGRRHHLVRDLHDRRGVRRAQGAQHPRPADAGRGGRSCRLRARARLCPRRRRRAACGGCSARARSACSTCCRKPAIASYLSGLLIGSEIEEALGCRRDRAGDARDPRDRRLAARLALSRRARGRATCACGRRVTMRAPAASS